MNPYKAEFILCLVFGFWCLATGKTLLLLYEAVG